MINKSALIKTIIFWIVLVAIIALIISFPEIAKILGDICIGIVVLFITYTVFSDDGSASYMDEF